jgi:hypothetical protein
VLYFVSGGAASVPDGRDVAPYTGRDNCNTAMPVLQRLPLRFFAFVPGRLRRLWRELIWELPGGGHEAYHKNHCPECKSSDVWLWELL